MEIVKKLLTKMKAPDYKAFVSTGGVGKLKGAFPSLQTAKI